MSCDLCVSHLVAFIAGPDIFKAIHKFLLFVISEVQEVLAATREQTAGFKMSSKIALRSDLHSLNGSYNEALSVAGPSIRS